MGLFSKAKWLYRLAAFILALFILYSVVNTYKELEAKHNVLKVIRESGEEKAKKEAKKRDIKVICSIRDYPWDEPHELGLQDWVANTQNLAIEMYYDEILVHGDKDIMPLLADRVRIENTASVISEIKDYITYTGYVVDKKLKKHIKHYKTNYINMILFLFILVNFQQIDMFFIIIVIIIN